MAAALAVALSLVIVSGFGPESGTDHISSVPMRFLATQSLAIAALLTAFRHATRLPADLRSSTAFALAWQGTATAFVTGVKRAGWITIACPALAFLSIRNIQTLGPRLTLLHLGVGLAVAILTMDAVFFHNRRLPLASVYVASADAKAAGLLYCAGVVTASFAVAFVERASFHDWGLYVGLLTTLSSIGACLRRFDRISPTAAIELDDESVSLPVQPLGLSLDNDPRARGVY
jgi:hypothetical protein